MSNTKIGIYDSTTFFAKPTKDKEIAKLPSSETIASTPHSTTMPDTIEVPRELLEELVESTRRLGKYETMLRLKCLKQIERTEELLNSSKPSTAILRGYQE